jgi:ubiquinone/menaquinone biosynthesis C-methylase UbiE
MTNPRKARRTPNHPEHRTMHESVWTREMAEAFLESPDRALSENPKELWARAGLRKGMTVVDIGSGSGYYALPASEIVGANGRVYAVDVSAELVEMVRERAAALRRENLVAVVSSPHKIPLRDGLADRVLLANVLHGLPSATVEEAARLLKSGGRLVNLDWKKESTPSGPPLEHRLSLAQTRAVLERDSLRVVNEGEIGPYHNLMVLEKGAMRGSPTKAR